ncbi:MAG TPA: TonB-dependent receptor [Bryobacteraceae bacterium]|nr:TonB-dependent receptor [Bryobacteraceae bacterium]
MSLRNWLLGPAWLLFAIQSSLLSQSINSGTVSGTVLDPDQMMIPHAHIELRNPVAGYSQTVTTDDSGAFRFNNVPENMYEIRVSAPGFASKREPVEVRSSVPISLSFTLEMAEVATTVEINASLALIDTDPSAHTDANSAAFMKLPGFDPASGLSSIINNSTGGTASDANGFFHPLGDHAQVSFVIDGQPISDQQSKVFSTQLPPNAVQSMELITGAPEAQYGDKSSLVVNATTKSGLGSRPFGSIGATLGSFGTYGENGTFGWGTTKLGNFIAVNGIRTGHFLDTPEFLPFHDIGNSENIFDRVDFLPSGHDALHLNLFLARNWFQVPNSYDQLSQDQKQRVLTWNVAPGYQHIFSSSTLLTINPFVRRDQVNYYGSRDPFSDTPVTESQNRFLTNYGVRADVATSHQRHNFKFGTQIQQTQLLENFTLGVTDPLFNPVCLGPSGEPLALPGILDPGQCSLSNPAYAANPHLLAGLVPYDLTRGGSYFLFHGAGNVNQFAFYATDDIRWGNFSVNVGFRYDQYKGLVSKNGPQPRLGLSYLVNRTGTVLRAAYSRTFETPFNENLLLSSATGSGGLAQSVLGAKASVPLEPGFRNQFNAGLQQKFGHWLLFDADYFWKYTHNGYDFDVLFNTPITFPIAWHNSKLDGLTGRLSTVNIYGFQAYTTFGHTRARYFPPEVGGLIFQGTASVPGVFRIDHDQAFQQTTNLRYQRGKDGPWGTFIWRYDSGLVVTGVPDSAAALALTPAQQADIGLACNGARAKFGSPLRVCTAAVTSTLLTLPQAGMENNDHNPDRVKPRNLFDIAFGTDNLLRAERYKMSLRFTVTNLTNKVALYNFLSTFSGTHFVAPRTYQAAIGYSF